MKTIKQPLTRIEKPHLVGFFTNFKSFMPTVSKSALVYTLLYRCFHIASSYQKIHNEINALKQKLNGYPIQSVDRCLKQFLEKLYVTEIIEDTASKKTAFNSFKLDFPVYFIFISS